MSTLPSQSPPRHYQPTEQDRAWLVRRLGYYLLHPLLFGLIVFRIGPNLFLFHTPFSPGPRRYLPYTLTYAPLIAGIKAYQRDTGKLPADSYEMPKKYRPKNFTAEEGEILNWTSITFPVDGNAVLEYEFTPVSEGWFIHSPRYNGRLPAPIVPAAVIPTTALAPTTSSSNGN